MDRDSWLTVVMVGVLVYTYLRATEPAAEPSDSWLYRGLGPDGAIVHVGGHASDATDDTPLFGG